MLNLIERMPIFQAMEILKKDDLCYSEDLMFKELNGDECVDIMVSTNLKNNIFIITDRNIVKKSYNGTISFKTDIDINLSGSRLISNNICTFDFFPHVKLIIPRGISCDFISPLNKTYFKHIIPEFELDPKINTDKSPEYFMWHNFKFTIDTDLDQIKKINKTLNITKNSEIVSIRFTPMYHVGNHSFPNLEFIYLINNDIIFSQCEELVIHD